jgi:tight adherence protein B
MKWIIAALFLLSMLLLIISIFQLPFASDRRLNKRLKYYLSLSDERPSGHLKMSFLAQIRLYKTSIGERLLSKKKKLKWERILAGAGIPLRPEEFIMFQWVSTALCAGFIYLLFGEIFLVMIGLVVGYALPRWWIRKKHKDRLNRFIDGLQDMITTVIGSLRAGFSFAQALKIVVDESESPMKEEMERVLKDIQYGSTTEDALQQLKERMPSEDLELVIQAILIQRHIGGNLAVILETIVQTLRDRSKIQRQIRTLTAQGRLSGIVIGALPVVLGIVIYLVQPDYIGILFSHPVGLIMLIYGLISGCIGFAWIRKLTSIEV